jgi:hypothetical protein
MDDDLQTEQMKAAQRRREETEQRLARESEDEHESAQHQRRADKAEYLRQKLEEREDSERE